MTELISIVIPIFNAEQYLEGIIESIIKQTYKKIELILVDDGSTDESRRIIEILLKYRFDSLVKSMRFVCKVSKKSRTGSR